MYFQSLLFLFICSFFFFSESSVPSASYLSLERWEAIYPLIFLAVLSIQSSVMVISSLFERTFLQDPDASLSTRVVETRRMQLRNLPF